MATRIEYEPAVDGGVRCRFCGGVLLAAARIVGSLEVSGLYEYEWAHTDGNPRCEPNPPKGAPYDAWHATACIERALDARRRRETGG